MDSGFFAKEAERLTKDPVLLNALGAIREGALAALVKADPSIPTDIARFQAKVVVCDQFMSELRQMIAQAAVKTRPTIV